MNVERGRIEIVVPGDANELSPNARMNPGKRMRLVKEWRTKARLLYQHGRHPNFAAKVWISFVIRRGRRVDSDNARSSGSLKAILDGFVDAGMVPNDTPRWVLQGDCHQACGPQWRDQPEVLVLIEEAKA